MTNRCGTGTGGSSQELDRELSDVLIAISVVSRRIADRISVVSGGEKVNMEGGSLNCPCSLMNSRSVEKP